MYEDKRLLSIKADPFSIEETHDGETEKIIVHRGEDEFFFYLEDVILFHFSDEMDEVWLRSGATLQIMPGSLNKQVIRELIKTQEATRVGHAYEKQYRKHMENVKEDFYAKQRMQRRQHEAKARMEQEQQKGRLLVPAGSVPQGSIMNPRKP